MVAQELSDEILNAWKSLIFIHAHVARSIESLLSDRQKISTTWFDVLWALRRAPERRLRFRTLDGEIALSRSALSRAVDALARSGLVEKQRCTNDARGIEVVLTEAGNRALAAAWPVYLEGIARFFARGLTPADCARLADILGRVQPRPMDSPPQS